VKSRASSRSWTRRKARSSSGSALSWLASLPDLWRDVADPDNRVADRYGVMRWRVPQTADVDSAEPGHTFVLVDEVGRIAWIRDYGAPENGGLMYVAPDDLIPAIDRALSN
jgi:hypothetical protein